VLAGLLADKVASLSEDAWMFGDEGMEEAGAGTE
jgi:hypothetical protein